MPIQQVISKGKVPVKLYTDSVEPQAREQLINLAHLPCVHKHIAVMPDVHYGKGATVGSVIPTLDAIIPAAVGVDIGCGMHAVQLTIKANDLPDNLRGLRLLIESVVPVGYAVHKQDMVKRSTMTALNQGLQQIIDKHRKIASLQKKPYQTWVRQLGTLGSGNHFIELCLDEADTVWVMLHSGSRGIGNAIGRYFIELAKKDMGKHVRNLPDQDLAYLQEGSTHYADYLHAVNWAQDYAETNRREMMQLICTALRKKLPKFGMSKLAIQCHHNYVSRETHFDQSLWITRKGAIRAGEGELGIIPGSMGAKSYIVRGKGNPQSYCSSSHGAGRVMSRNKAKQRFNTDDLLRQTEGIECRKDKAVLDEIPSAYKDIDTVMQHQHDLVEIVHTLRQVICIKG
ncbi:MAG: RtcB family protein [Gammaproteobacteria bacterium]|nr:RtcB family protein [Gammaproteobacteria bacterium]